MIKLVNSYLLLLIYVARGGSFVRSLSCGRFGWRLRQRQFKSSGGESNCRPIMTVYPFAIHSGQMNPSPPPLLAC